MFCEQCGTELEPEARFCQNCGSRVVIEGAQLSSSESVQRSSVGRLDRLPRKLLSGTLVVLVLAGTLVWFFKGSISGSRPEDHFNEAGTKQEIKGLSRSEAAEIIAKERFPRPVHVDVYSTFHVEADTSDVCRKDPIAALQTEGLIVCSMGPPNVPGFNFSNSVTVQLTEKGKKYVLTREGRRLGGSLYLFGGTLLGRDYKQVVRGCETKFLKVTGINLIEFGQKTAVAEYDWTYGNPTSFGRLSVGGKCKKELGKVQKDKAEFVLYDDGWRLK